MPRIDIGAQRIGQLLALLRQKSPLVQNITNFVAMDISANVLLAIGASPAMVHAEEEVLEFLSLADALVVNVGTLSAPFAVSMKRAARSAYETRKPWVLDPVGAGGSAFRNEVLADLARQRPTIIRGNASEILSLARICGLSGDAATPKGVDSRHASHAAEAAATALAQYTGGTVAATGAVDFITDGTRCVRLGNGDVLMSKVTALGCALSAVCAGFVTVADDPFEAAASAIGIFSVAGEMAAQGAQGPGSFRVAFLDMLHKIGSPEVEICLKMTA